jgi:hypothetical protein
MTYSQSVYRDRPQGTVRYRGARHGRICRYCGAGQSQARCLSKV